MPKPAFVLNCQRGTFESVLLTDEQRDRSGFPLPFPVYLTADFPAEPYGIIPKGSKGYIVDRDPHTGALALDFGYGGVSALMPFETDDVLDAVRVDTSRPKTRFMQIAALVLVLTIPFAMGYCADAIADHFEELSTCCHIPYP